MAIIVMTGGTSGIGQVAARGLGTRATLLLGARHPDRARLPALELDLAQLDSVRRFAAEVETRLGSRSIDALVLNAGLSRADVDARTRDGFELTFAVNHLAHYLLARLLAPRLAPGGRVVVTTSGTHDPDERTLVPPPRHARARLLADPALDPALDGDPRAAAGHAYAASKLCNILTVRALRARGLSALAYDPGPTPGTGLARARTPLLRALWWLLGTPLGRLAPRFNSVIRAGEALRDAALGEPAPPRDGYYLRLRRGRLEWATPSRLARDDDARDALWRDSAALVGMAD